MKTIPYLSENIGRWFDATCTVPEAPSDSDYALVLVRMDDEGFDLLYYHPYSGWMEQDDNTEELFHTEQTITHWQYFELI